MAVKKKVRVQEKHKIGRRRKSAPIRQPAEMFSAEEMIESIDPRISRLRLNEYKNRLSIDKFNLDVEVTTFPSLLNDVLEAFEKAAVIRDDHKAKLERTEAEVSQNIRYRMEKDRADARITNKMVADAVASDPDVELAKQLYIMSREIAGQWQALRSSFEQKGSMLKLVVALYGSNYYTASSASSKEMGDAAHKQAREVLAEARKKKGLKKKVRSRDSD